MKFTFFAALIAAVSQARPNQSDLHKYTFQQFVQDFDLGIDHSSTEYATRLAIFEKELERVNRHNNSNATWTETVNHMSHLTATEKSAFHGRTKGRVSRLDSQKDRPAD